MSNGRGESRAFFWRKPLAKGDGRWRLKDVKKRTANKTEKRESN
jgi:hypothetical protein